MIADVSISEYKMADQLKTVVIASVIGATLAGKECCGAEEVVPDGVTDEVTSGLVAKRCFSLLFFSLLFLQKWNMV